MAAEDDEVTPPGWYRQPEDPTLLRWWDGDDWTEDTMPVPGSGRARTRPSADPSSGGAGAAAPARSGPRRTRAQAMAELEAEAPPTPSGEPTAEVPLVADEPTAMPVERSPRRSRSERPARIAAPVAGGDGATEPDGEPPAVEILVEPTPDGDRPVRRAQPRRPRAAGSDDGAEGTAHRRTGTGTGSGSGTVRVLGDDGWPEPERRSLQATDADWAGSTWPADAGERARSPRPGGARSAGGAGRGAPGPSGPRRQRPPEGRRAEGGARPTTVERSARGARTKDAPPAGPPQLGKVLVRALVIAVLVGVGYLGYVRLRDAAPDEAATLSESPAPVTVDPDAPRLDQIVLTLADLPLGWEVQAVDPSDDDICDGRVPRSVIEPTALQSAYFSGEAGSLIGNVIHEFPNVDTARAFMELTAEVVDSCREYAEGDTASISLKPLDFPRFGDETFVAQVTGSAPGGASHGAIVYVRVGNRVASVVTIAFGEGDVNKELVEHLTQLVERRMERQPETGALPEG